MPETTHADQESPPDTPGKQGDVIHVLRYDARTGQATRDGVIEVPAPSGSPTPQDFPPRTDVSPQSWPRDLAVSRDGKTLLAALNLADRAAVIDTDTREVRYVETGSYPYGAAIDGNTGFVSNESDGTVSVIDLRTASKIKDITVGPHLSHPEGIAVDPRTQRAYVAVTHQDLIAVIDTARPDRRADALGRAAGGHRHRPGGRLGDARRLLPDVGQLGRGRDRGLRAAGREWQDLSQRRAAKAPAVAAPAGGPAGARRSSRSRAAGAWT